MRKIFRLVSRILVYKYWRLHFLKVTQLYNPSEGIKQIAHKPKQLNGSPQQAIT